jgi:S-adenosylmethionine/arginine decarboxylase-like enzyme
MNMTVSVLKKEDLNLIVSDSALMSYEDLKTLFKQENAWGLSTCVDLTDCDPDLIRCEQSIRKYVVELCDLIEMKRFGETVVVNFGEDEKVAGYSMTQLIETSLISGHFANLTNSVYMDVFSCKLYDPAVVADFTKKFFKAKNVTINYVLRK